MERHKFVSIYTYRSWNLKLDALFTAGCEGGRARSEKSIFSPTQTKIPFLLSINKATKKTLFISSLLPYHSCSVLELGAWWAWECRGKGIVQQNDIFHLTQVIVAIFLAFAWIYFSCFASWCVHPIRLLILLGNFLFRILIFQILLPFFQAFVFIGLWLVNPSWVWKSGGRRERFISRKHKARSYSININLLVFCFSIPRFRRQLSLSEKSAVHQLYDEISFLCVSHGDLCNPFRMTLFVKRMKAWS